jgi:hypothetical protein
MCAQNGLGDIIAARNALDFAFVSSNITWYDAATRAWVGYCVDQQGLCRACRMTMYMSRSPNSTQFTQILPYLVTDDSGTHTLCRVMQRVARCVSHTASVASRFSGAQSHHHHPPPTQARCLATTTSRSVTASTGSYSPTRSECSAGRTIGGRECVGASHAHVPPTQLWRRRRRPYVHSDAHHIRLRQHVDAAACVAVGLRGRVGRERGDERGNESKQ